MKFNFIDLFCGLGGFRIAMEKNGGSCVFSSDNDPKVAEVYQNNFNENPLNDITITDEKNIPDHDILCAGFPCQAFSIGGHRKGFKDTRGTLFFDVLRILNYKKPKAFFLENVKGITNHDSGNTINIIRNKLNLSGYNLFENVLNVSKHGLPQNRERWYCVGFRKDLQVKTFRFPDEVPLKLTLNKILSKNVYDHPISKIAHNQINFHTKKYLKEKSKQQSIIKKTKMYTVVTEARKSKASIRNDGISPCLTAKMGTGGNNVPMIYELGRKFTVKECLALMGFPKEYKIKANNQQSYKQVGNSVCVLLIEKISKNIIEVLKQ